MALHFANFLHTEDEVVDSSVMRDRTVPRGKKPRVTVEALAWIALVLLSFGPLFGYLLATLL